jgi:hypothetical protein
MPKKPESHAGSTYVATRTSMPDKGDRPDFKRYPGPPGSLWHEADNLIRVKEYWGLWRYHMDLSIYNMA